MLLDPKATKPWFRNAHSRGSRNTVASVSIAQWPFWVLCSSSFSRDPPADVRWAILEGDAVGFAPLEKTDGIAIH